MKEKKKKKKKDSAEPGKSRHSSSSFSLPFARISSPSLSVKYVSSQLLLYAMCQVMFSRDITLPVYIATADL
jgi:hypothetical protein